MTDTPRSTPAFAVKPGPLADDLRVVADRVANGVPTPRERRLENTLDMIAKGVFSTEDAAQGLAWCQAFARSVLKS